MLKTFSGVIAFKCSKLFAFKFFILAILFCITASFLSAQQTARSTTIPETVRGDPGKQIDVYLSQASALGFSGQILAAKNGEVVLHKAYGVADRSLSIPTTLTTKFGIASMSKQFTAAAILKLEDEGKLSVKDSVSKYIPDVPEDKRAITIHQILTHTSGLKGGYTEDFEALSREELLQRILREPVATPPEKGWRYSSEAYSLLAVIVENVSGLSYEDFMRTKLFAPADMTHTGFWHSKWSANEVSHAYAGWNDKGSPASWIRNWRVLGGGDIVSTTEDLYRWELALRAGKILSADAIKRYMMPHAKIQGEDYYAYGLFVSKTPRKTTMIEHGGDTELGFNGAFFRYVDENTVLIITCNSRDYLGRSMRQSVQEDIEKMLFGNASVISPPDVKPITNVARSSLNGTYNLNSNGKFHLIDDGSFLWLAAENQQVINLLIGAKPEVETLYKNANERTTGLINGLRRREQKALETALTTEGTQFLQDYLQEWNDLTKTYGVLHQYRILGTITRGQAALTYARLQFRDREITMTFRWLDGGKGRLSGTNTQAPPFPLIAPVAIAPNGDLIVYDLFQQKTLATIKRDSKTDELQVSFPVSSKTDRAKKTNFSEWLPIK